MWIHEHALRHSNMLWRHLLSLRWRLIANFASVKLSEFEPAARVSSALEINARNTCSGRLLRIYYYLISGHMLSNHVSVGVVRTLGHQTRWFVKFVAFANVAPAKHFVHYIWPTTRVLQGCLLLKRSHVNKVLTPTKLPGQMWNLQGFCGGLERHKRLEKLI